MKRLLLCAALAAVPLIAAMAQDKTGDEADPLKQKAAELVKDKASKAEKVVAIYNFVRDEITQIPSKFG